MFLNFHKIYHLFNYYDFMPTLIYMYTHTNGNYNNWLDRFVSCFGNESFRMKFSYNLVMCDISLILFYKVLWLDLTFSITDKRPYLIRAYKSFTLDNSLSSYFFLLLLFVNMHHWLIIKGQACLQQENWQHNLINQHLNLKL